MLTPGSIRTGSKISQGVQRCRLLGGGLLLLLLLGLCSCTTTVVRDAHLTARELAELPVEKLKLEEQKKLENLSPEQLVQLGRVQLGKGAIPLARLHFLRALKKTPESTAALGGLAETFEQAKDYKKARNFYSLTLEREPRNLAALVGMGRIFRKLGANEKSLDFLMQAMRINDRDPAVLAESALTYEALGMELLAEPLHAESVAMHPEMASTHNNLGFNFLLQKRYDDAIAAFSRGLSLDPDNLRIKNNLGAAHALRGDEGKALQVFETAVGKAGAYNNLGYIYMTHGDWDKAEKSFKRALELQPVFYVKAQHNLDRLKELRKAAE